MSKQDPDSNNEIQKETLTKSNIQEDAQIINGRKRDGSCEMDSSFKSLPETSVSAGSFSSLLSSKLENDVSSPNPTSLRRPATLSGDEPSPKRMRLEIKPSDKLILKKNIVDWKGNKLHYLRDSYNEYLFELFFLKQDGNLMDMHGWLKKPPVELFQYVKRCKLEGDDSAEAKLLGHKATQINFGSQNKLDSPNSAVDHTTLTHKSFSNESERPKALPSSDPSGQDQMIEKAKQEVYIIQRINALRKEGLWGEKKLPKVQEPQRCKAHWDYLLEEMVWLSADFAQERKWKKAAAKKCAKMVQKYFQDKAVQAQKAEREQEMKLRKMAAFVAKEVRTFWGNIGKIIEYKVNARLDEKKKKAIDQQLSFIVDQTEKYSSMLAESMKKPGLSSNLQGDQDSTSRDSPISDGEFKPNESSSDDEGTIAKEDDNPDEQASELKLLQEESEQTLSDLLNTLPPEYFQEHGITLDDNSEKVQCKDTNNEEKLENKEHVEEPMEIDDQDEDFEAEESEKDDENTIEEQEEIEGKVDYPKEIKELEAENEIPVDELRKKYEELAAGAEPFEDDVDSEDESLDTDVISSNDPSYQATPVDSESEVSHVGSGDDNSVTDNLATDDEDDALGLEDLIDQSFHDSQDEDNVHSKERSEKADKELQDASAVAESLQPKGFTLSSTSVTTPVPFLLKHTLREYQHVGLDWLVTMYDKKLNGILADEMGLGKTIQTIALLAHLACEIGSWGPHLIVVPTSVMLNWEMEFKKWCPAFKILTYYGSQKERKLKRQGWTKPNAFHVCITSYKLVIQDHQSFRRKKWKYFILDEAQNIKNFKSQRWQLLLNFQSQRRLLLTGTPLQNSLMELWSLMHFLMPNIFASHREFREWFSNPVTGMIEGNKEYNDSIIKRLHKVLRPFILRRLKSEVEQQMPKKFEHIIMCRLSKRQRFLYEEFMARTKTKDTLASGNFLSVINILMQLRKVCNHPNLFEPRPIISPFMMEGINYIVPSCVYGICDYDPFKHVDLLSLNLLLIDLELCLTAFASHRIRRFQAPHKLIEEIDSISDPPPKCPAGKIKLHVRPSSQPVPRAGTSSATSRPAAPSILTLKPVTPNQLPNTHTNAAPTTTTNNSQQWQAGVRFQLVQHGGSYKAIPLPPGSTGGMIMQQTAQGPRLVMPQRLTQAIGTPSVTSNNTVTTTTTSTASTGTALSGLQLVQTSTGQYILTSSPLQKTVSSTATSLGVTGNTAVALLQRLQGIKSLQGSVITTGAGGRPVLRLPTSSLRPAVPTPSSQPATPVSTSPLITNSKLSTPQNTPQSTPVASPVKTASSPANLHAVSLNNSFVSSPSKTVQTRSLVTDFKDDTSKKKESIPKSIFSMNDLEEGRKLRRKQKLKFIAQLNTRRCLACPIYGADLIEAVTVTVGSIKNGAFNHGLFRGQGFLHSFNASKPHLQDYWMETNHLRDVVMNPTDQLNNLREILNRFVFCVPAVIAGRPKARIFHPHPSTLNAEQCREVVLQKELAQPVSFLHPVANASVTQFPDVRLIQYDCGKLQTLDHLLRHLKSGGHRVLIFTQMTKMLDVFEAFLNYHGHLYLRLDGTTKVDQRQSLMERFNQDKRLFSMILSTRSGGVGVNLTGADTVIFYDSDWNPTMDAQAQDRCHRIGQTRDVHIYRLISEKTIEENILKKANQKRMLGDLAIEGGNFTTAQLKKQTIHDLFEVDANEQDASKRMSEVLERNQSQEEVSGKPEEDTTKLFELESALAVAEDETDVQAMKTAKAEAAADLAEFNEDIPIEEDMEEMSKAEQELSVLMNQLTPIEKYAMQFLEESDEGITAEAERLAAEIDQQKKEWEIEHLQAMQEEEARLKNNSDDDFLTYSSIDAHNQMWVSYGSKEVMPTWGPPTPPRDDNDLYIDHCLLNWYDSDVIPETSLPPVYIKKENKRIKMEHVGTSSAIESSSNLRAVPKIKREDTVYPPHSLFDRPSPALLKMRRDVKSQKVKGLARPTTLSPMKQQYMGKGYVETESLAEWLIHEDWNILHAVQKVLQLPLSLFVVSLGHTPNWDLVSDLINSYSLCYRSPRHIRHRYETVILPREESKDISSTTETIKKLAKKQKGVNISRPQNVRGLGTGQLFQQDNNSRFSAVSSTRIELIKTVAAKRAPSSKPMFVNPTAKNPKHVQVFSDNGIQYDEPLTPTQVAAKRAERFQQEKQQKYQRHNKLSLQHQSQQQTQLTVNFLQQQQQQVHQIVQPQQSSVAVVAASSGSLQQQQPVVVSSGVLGKGTTSVVLTQGTVGTLVSSTISASVNSTTANALTTVTASANATATLLGGTRVAASAVQGANSGRTTLTLQDLQGRTGAPQATVVSMASLTQLQAAKLTASLGTQGNQQRAMASVPVQARTVTHQQMQYLRQQAQRQTLALQAGKAVVSSTSGEQQTIKRVQIAGQSGSTGQKLQVAVPGITALQVTQSGRAQLVKSAQVSATSSTASTSSATPGKNVTRTVTESEMNAFLRRQPHQIGKAGSIAQMLAKQRSLVNVKGTTTVGLLGAKTGVGGTGLGTVQILQPGPTQKHITMQQFHQVLKQVQPQTIHQIQQGTVVGKAVVAASTAAAGTSGNLGTSTAVIQGTLNATPATKLIPMTVSQQTQPIKQTIQVVSAGSTTVGGNSPSMRVNNPDRPTGITLQGSTVRVANPALLSQVSVALQGQPVSVAVRPSNSNAVRIQTTAVSTTQSQQQQSSSQTSQQQQ